MNIGKLKEIINNIPDRVTVDILTENENIPSSRIGFVAYDEEMLSLFFGITGLTDEEIAEELSYLEDAKLLYARYDDYDMDSVTDFFERYNAIIKQYGIFVNPYTHRIEEYNVDEHNDNRLKMIHTFGLDYVIALEKELGRYIT